MNDLKKELNLPVIAKLCNGWDLVAHPNGPAVVNEHTLSILVPRDDHESELSAAICEGQAAFIGFAYRELVASGRWPCPKNATR